MRHPAGAGCRRNVTLTDGEETYAFPVKSAGYVKLCDDEDLFG